MTKNSSKKVDNISKSVIKKIKKEVEKSGHPVSLKTSIILNKKGWYVRNAPRYFDSNLKISREIDIVAQKKSIYVKDAIDVLIIECKKSKGKPWVFFRQNKFNADVLSLNVDMAETTEGAIYDWLGKHIFKKHYYYKRPCHTYYFVANANPASKAGKQIFDATEQVLSALRFYLVQRFNLFSEYRLKPKIPTFFYPIIVFDGKMFEVSVEEADINIKETDWISLWIEKELKEPLLMKFLYRQGFRRVVYSKPIVIDIVKLDYFEEFLKNFDKLSSDQK